MSITNQEISKEMYDLILQKLYKTSWKICENLRFVAP